MDRMNRIGRKDKGAPSSVRKDEDESLILFGELYKREKERDLNLLEPMYSIEFEAFQGDGHMFKLPSGKKDFLVAEDEKHDYDWLKTPPATPLFPSLEMEANSSKMVFQKEIPILRPLNPSRFSGKPEVTKTAAARSESPIPSSSKPVTLSARPDSSSKKNIKGAPALSKEQNSAYRLDKRSSYTALTARKLNAVPTITNITNPNKKNSDKKPASQGTSNVVKKTMNPEFPDKAPKNLITTVPIYPGSAPSVANARSTNRILGIGDLKLEGGKNRRLSCPPAATRGGNKELQSDGTQNLAAKGRTQVAGGPSSGTGSRAETTIKARRRIGGEKDQRPKHGSHVKK